MKYQSDAHHYRKVVRKRRNSQRIKGISLIAVSLALMFYAVPCFAVSVFDYGQPEKASSTSFSGEISDYATAEEAAAAAFSKGNEETASGAAEEAGTGALAPAYAVSDYSLISNTTGPGALSNEAAVSAARTRSEALAAIASGDASKASSSALAIFAGSAPTASDSAAVSRIDVADLVFASIALAAGIVCAVLGVRMIVRGRQIRGMQIAAAYGHALRA